MEPFEMGPARRFEARDQILPVIVAATASIRTVDLVNDTAVAIKESSHKRHQEAVRYREAPDGQTLSRSEADRAEPFIESRVVKLGVVDDPACRRRMTLDAILSPEEPQIGRDQLTVAGFEID